MIIYHIHDYTYSIFMQCLDHLFQFLDPAVRIKELKQMVQAMHENGIRVIIDVVYNHTGFGDAGQYSFSLSTPEYYYRYNDDGSLSDASACGNETASERPMMRKYMLESVKYWIDEYHLDGFRFDLMGIHDIETMNAISAAARENQRPGFVVRGRMDGRRQSPSGGKESLKGPYPPIG